MTNINTQNNTQNNLVLTKQDVKKIKKQIQELKEKIIPQINKELKEAIADGDLRENAPFDIAKQRFVEARNKLNELETMLKQAKIVENNSKKQHIKLGSTVKIIMNGQEQEITIVSNFEANPLQNKFAIDSPIAKALINKTKGDTAKLITPSGNEVPIQIVEVY